MEISKTSVTTKLDYDRASELKAFDETKDGVKRLVDASITNIPRMFHHEFDKYYSSSSSTTKLVVPSGDLVDIHQDPTKKQLLRKLGKHLRHGVSFKLLIMEYKLVFWMSNIDLYTSPAASWRDTFHCFMAPHSPKAEDLPSVCSCRDIMLEYSKQVMKLGNVLLELLSEALGVNPNYLNDIGCNEGFAIKHTDNDFLTVLLQDHIGGLQLLRENS
ncbi:hypothetical protein RYX36_024830 [Vicia faba]